MWVSTENGGPSNELIGAAVVTITTQVLTAAIATSAQGDPWIFTAYVAFDGNRFWFTSQESTRHVGESRRFPAVGVAMWKAPTVWGEKLLGLQLAGRVSEVLAPEEAQIGLR